MIIMDGCFVDKEKDFVTSIKSEVQSEKMFLFENNPKNIEEIEKFLKSNKKLLVFSGFLGTGKKYLLDKTLSLINPQTILLEYTCFETTILDDILLSFFDSFKKFIALGIIEQPKIKSENFTQKINSYFKTIDKPIIVRINSIQNILKDNKVEIFGFLKSLTNYSNIKIILVSRKQELLPEISDFCAITATALEKNLFEKYLKSEGIKNIGPISDELYRHTKGYWLYTVLSVKVMKLRNLELIDFISGYTKSMMSFGDFIFRELLSFIDPVSGHLFRFLTLMRHPVSVNLLAELNLWDEVRVQFFIDNLILYKIGNLVYLPEHYKIIAQNTITGNISEKIHRSCVQLYETQIPLKPFERELLLSRATMRKEIEYHNTFVPQRPQFTREPLTGIQFAVREKSQPKAEVQPPKITTLESSKEAIKKVSFIFDESALNDIAASINDFVESSHQNAIVQDEINNLNIIELLNLAKSAEAQFDYKKVIAICQRALTLNGDDNYCKCLPAIYTKLAQTYKKLSDWFSANKYFELATDFFEAAGDLEKAAETKFEIASICFATFKSDIAKEIAESIISAQNISENIIVKTILLLIDIAENGEDKTVVEKYFALALDYAPKVTDNAVLSELYYKYGAYNDADLNFEKAIEYYKKCVTVSKNYRENPYLSPAYSNISSICAETNNWDLAVKYASESLKISELTQNTNGIYDCAIKLANLFKKRDYEKTVEYFKLAKSSAIKLNEPFYIVSADVSFGDFIIHHGKIENALKLYLQALSIAKKYFKPSNISKIETRINDIKSKIGLEKFNKILQGMSNEQSI